MDFHQKVSGHGACVITLCHCPDSLLLGFPPLTGKLVAMAVEDENNPSEDSIRLVKKKDLKKRTIEFISVCANLV